MKYRARSKLGDYLEERGITKTWLADKINADRSQVSKWCTNDVNGVALATPQVPYLIMVLEVLDCKLTDIYEIVDQ